MLALRVSGELHAVKARRLTARFEVLQQDIRSDSKFLDQSTNVSNPRRRQQNTWDALSSPFLPQIDGHTLFVPSDTTPPRADSVHVEFSPNTKRVTNVRGLHFDHFSPKMPAE